MVEANLGTRTYSQRRCCIQGSDANEGPTPHFPTLVTTASMWGLVGALLLLRWLWANHSSRQDRSSGTPGRPLR